MRGRGIAAAFFLGVALWSAALSQFVRWEVLKSLLTDRLRWPVGLDPNLSDWLALLWAPKLFEAFVGAPFDVAERAQFPKALLVLLAVLAVGTWCVARGQLVRAAALWIGASAFAFGAIAAAKLRVVFMGCALWMNFHDGPPHVDFREFMQWTTAFLWGAALLAGVSWVALQRRQLGRRARGALLGIVLVQSMLAVPLLYALCVPANAEVQISVLPAWLAIALLAVLGLWVAWKRELFVSGLASLLVLFSGLVLFVSAGCQARDELVFSNTEWMASHGCPSRNHELGGVFQVNRRGTFLPRQHNAVATDQLVEGLGKVRSRDEAWTRSTYLLEVEDGVAVKPVVELLRAARQAGFERLALVPLDRSPVIAWTIPEANANCSYDVSIRADGRTLDSFADLNALVAEARRAGALVLSPAP